MTGEGTSGDAYSPGSSTSQRLKMNPMRLKPSAAASSAAPTPLAHLSAQPFVNVS
jgi:hypothetical protein